MYVRNIVNNMKWYMKLHGFTRMELSHERRGTIAGGQTKQKKQGKKGIHLNKSHHLFIENTWLEEYLNLSFIYGIIIPVLSILFQKIITKNCSKFYIMSLVFIAGNLQNQRSLRKVQGSHL